MYLFISDKFTPATRRSLESKLVSNGFSKNEIAFQDKDDANASTIRNKIRESDLKGIVICGSESIKGVFEKAPNKCSSLLRTKGFTTPYTLKNGNIIPCVITYDLKIASISKDENLKQVFIDNLVSVRDPVDLTETTKLPKVVLCKDFTTLKECAEKIKNCSIVGWDFETTGLKPYKQHGKSCEVFSIAFAFDDDTSYAIPLYNYFPSNMQTAVLDLLYRFFYSFPDVEKVAHNTKFDLLFGLVHIPNKEGDSLQGKWQDSSLLCAILDEMPVSSGLKLSAFRYLGVSDWSVEVKNVAGLPLDDVLYYNALDSYYTLKLHQMLYSKISKNAERKRLYDDILLPAMLQFTKIEKNGVHVDLSRKNEMQQKCQKRLDECAKIIVSESKMVVTNPKSTIQLKRYFSDVKKYNIEHKTAKGGLSTGESSLKDLVAVYKDKVAESLLEYREMEKIQSTYVLGMDKNIYDDGKIHGSYNLTSTVTGRTSSSEPNMQNFPKRKSQYVRSMVVAPEGYKLCSFDYGQIEARLFAVITGDENYLKDLSEGYDIHMDTAIWIFHTKLGWDKEKAEKQRSKIKNSAVFPAFYGAGIKTISSNLGVSPELANEFKQRLFTRYSKVKDWQTEIVAEEQEKGYITSLFGRRRRSPIKYNELLNFTCQSTASDMTLSAMNLLGRKYQIALMVHDDLSFYLPNDDKLEQTIINVCNEMLAIPWFYLAQSDKMKSYAPLQVECSVGDNWGEQTEVLKISSNEVGYNSLEESVIKAKESIEYYMSYPV